MSEWHSLYNEQRNFDVANITLFYYFIHGLIIGFRVSEAIA